LKTIAIDLLTRTYGARPRPVCTTRRDELHPMRLEMKRFPLFGGILSGALLLGLAACGGTRVDRIDPGTTVDLSGYWNDTDSRLVAEEMISDAMGTAWRRQFMQRNGGELPTVIFGTVRNRTTEHIAVNTFLRDMERAFVNSGDVQVVADRDERGEIREERTDQQTNATPETRARLRNELGADYILIGEITSIEDVEGGRAVVSYQVDLNLTDLESNLRVWVGQKKLKKFIQRRRRD